MAIVTLSAVEYAAKPSSTGWFVVLRPPPSSSTLSVESGVANVTGAEELYEPNVVFAESGDSVVGNFRGFNEGSFGGGGSSSGSS